MENGGRGGSIQAQNSDDNGRINTYNLAWLMYVPNEMENKKPIDWVFDFAGIEQ